MTKALPTTTTRDEISAPVVARQTTTGYVVPKVPSEEALKVLNLEPVRTVWGWDTGKPIYERLPAISQQYQLGYDKDQAYAYIEPQFGTMLGPGSLEPGILESDFSMLVVESGTITWKKGQVEVTRLEIDVSTLDNGKGLLPGEYQVGYLLTYDKTAETSDVPGFGLAYVSDGTLADAAVNFGSDREGEAHPDYYALTDWRPETAWWPDNIAAAGPYEEGCWFTIDFQASVLAEHFRITPDPELPATAKLAVYHSDDAIIWHECTQAQPANGEWNAILSEEHKHRYWRLFFWDGEASISEIYYTGEAYFPDNRSAADWTIATPYLDGKYEDVPGDYYLIAEFTVGDERTITELGDQRRTIDRKYEPVAEWLTSFQDLQLRCQFENIERYAELYMAPPTSDFHFYQELDTNPCSGNGHFDIGEYADHAITFPEIVELDPVNPGTIVPKQVWDVGYFIEESDLASKLSTDIRLNDWNIDNGIY